ncbi:MAG: cell surface protein SprA, partial [Candidatus Cloacimonetes bacterium]|nr:cell surface protein SprA [Candidatus Cloacimonadota bacterium]
LDNLDGADPEWPLPDAFFGYSAPNDSVMIAELGDIYDWWDINGNFLKDAWEPWSFDDYLRYPDDRLPPDRSIDKSHGWEGNSRDSDQISPDSEDRNGNKSVELENSYFSYTVPLNPANPDFDRYAFPNERGWVYIRIPLADDNVQVVGNPNLTLVNGVRLWFSGNTHPLDLDIAEFNIVGNEWRQAIVEESDTSHYDVTVLNNFDNNQFYYGPPGVEGQKDFLTQEVSREQSLVLQLENLPFGETAWVKKQFATPQTFSEYRRMRMFLHGGSFTRTELTGEVPGEVNFVEDNTLEFRYRIESAQNNFYEYSKFIHPGWNPANSLDVLFTEITALESFTAAGKEQEEPGKPITLADGGQLRVQGNPSINQVRSLYFGVRNHSAQPANTQVWFNELRLTDVKKENGSAFRAKVDANFSDVLNLNANFEQQDAEFHNVKQRSAGANATFTQKRSIQGDTDLGRLMPPDWNTNLNVSGGWSYDYRLPKYFPNDDSEVDRNNHPEWVEDVSLRRNARASVRKTKSESWLGKQLIDKASLSYDVSETVSRNKLIEGDTTVTQNFTFGYNNTIDWKHRLRPLFFLPDWPLIGKYSEAELNYFPNKFNLGANTSRTLRDKLDRDGTFQHTETYTLNRNWATGFAPLTIFSVEMNRAYQNNLLFDRGQTSVPANDPTRTSDDEFYVQYERWLQGKASFHDGDHNITQGMNFRFTPELLAWLSTDFTYNTSYTWRRTLVEPARGVDLGSRGDFRTSMRLKTKDVLQAAMFTNTAKLSEYQSEFQEEKAARTAERDRKRSEREALKAQRKAARQQARDKKSGDGNEDESSPPAQAPEQQPEEQPELTEGGTAPAMVASPVEPVAQDPVVETPPSAPEPEPESAPVRRSLFDQLPDSVKLSAQDSLVLMREQAKMDSLILAARGTTPPAKVELPAGGDSLLVTAADDEERGPNPVIEWLTRVRKRLALGTNAFDDVTITFNRTGSFGNPGQAVLPWTHTASERHAALLYQLGLSRDTGFDTLGVGSYVVQTQRSFGYDYKLGTKVRFIKSVPINLSYDFAFDQSYTNDRESSRRKSENGWFSFSNETLSGGTFNDGDLVGGNPSLKLVPNYNLTIGGLDKLPVIRTLVTSLNLNHSYTGKLETSYTISSTRPGMERSRLSYTRNFSPLAGFDFSTNNDWSGNLNFNQSRTLTVTTPENPGNRSLTYNRRTEMQVSGSKRLKKGFKLPLMKTGFQNDTTVRLEYTRSNNMTVNSIRESVPNPDGEGDPVQILVWNTPQTPSNWKLRASTDFEFSRNVRGGAWYEFGSQRSGTVADQMTYTEFGMNCTIQIRNARGGGSSSSSGGRR